MDWQELYNMTKADTLGKRNDERGEVDNADDMSDTICLCGQVSRHDINDSWPL